MLSSVRVSSDYGNFGHRTPLSRACWMNRLSAMARRSSLPKRIDRPCADAYCSAGRAASMLAVSAARTAVSAVPDLVGALADLPFPLPLPLPFGLTRAPLSSFIGEPGVSPCAVTIWGGAVLLTHQHAISNVKENSLVELSHVPMGVPAVFAGWARWLELRLPRENRAIASWIWPICFVLIGAGLLNYREM